MSMIKDVATYLAANTDLKKGVDLFQAGTPDAPADCVILTDTGGGAPEQELPVDKPTIQVLCRGSAARYAETVTRAEEIFALLNRKFEFTIGDVSVMYARAIASPQCLGQDDKKRWLISTNYQFQIRTT